MVTVFGDALIPYATVAGNPRPNSGLYHVEALPAIALAFLGRAPLKLPRPRRLPITQATVLAVASDAPNPL